MPLTRRKPTPDTYAAEDDVYEKETPETTEEREVIPARSGWDAAEETAKKVKSGGGSFFTFKEEPTLIMFMQGAPVDSYLLHWVDVAPKKRRSFRCMESHCKFCDLGDNPSAKFAFWVAEFEFEGDDVNVSSRILEAGTRLKNTLRDIDGDPRKGGPLEFGFFSTHRTGSGNSTQYHVSRVKDRDLDEDWRISPTDARSATDDLEPPKFYAPRADDIDAAVSYLKNL